MKTIEPTLSSALYNIVDPLIWDIDWGRYIRSYYLLSEELNRVVLWYEDA